MSAAFGTPSRAASLEEPRPASPRVESCILTVTLGMQWSWRRHAAVTRTTPLRTSSPSVTAGGGGDATKVAGPRSVVAENQSSVSSVCGRTGDSQWVGGRREVFNSEEVPLPAELGLVQWPVTNLKQTPPAPIRSQLERRAWPWTFQGARRVRPADWVFQL